VSDLDRLLADIDALERDEIETDDPNASEGSGETDEERRARALRELDALLALEDDSDDVYPWWDSARWIPPDAREPTPVPLPEVSPRPSYLLEDWEIDALPRGGPLRVWVGGRLIGVGGRR